MSEHIEKWDFYELAMQGPEAGNPFTEVHFEADFAQHGRTVRVAGFYDGSGIYKVRFMPDQEGEWAVRHL